MEPLPADDRTRGLARLPEWALGDAGTSISRSLRFADFPTAFAFMTAVALDAQAANHHPDWSNSYSAVTVELSTHAAGGITQLDLDLAARVDHHAAALGGATDAGPGPDDCR